MKKLALGLLLVLLLTVSCKNTSPTGVKPSNEVLQDVFDLINEARAHARQCGNREFPAVAKLKYNRLLEIAAQKHSEDMNSTGILSHDSPPNAKHYPQGTKTITRVRKEGYQPAIVLENIGRGQTTAKQIVNEWLASPDHCKSIMSSEITETGLGHSGIFWAEDFAKPN